MRALEAREMLSAEEMEDYSKIQQKLINLGYLNKSGSSSKKGKTLINEFADQFGEGAVLNPWIDAKKQKQQAALKLKLEKESPELLPEKLTEIADILDKVYDYGTNEDDDGNNEGVIKLSLPTSFEYNPNESPPEWMIKANTDATLAYLICNQACFKIDDLDTLPAARLAETIHYIIIRFQGKTDGYIRAIQYLEQGAIQAGLHVHYGNFNHSINGGLFDTVNGNDLIIGITAQLHADNKVWARARISETGELDILSGSAGDTVIGRAKSAQEVTQLLRSLMDTHSLSSEKELKNTEEFSEPEKPYAGYLREANGDVLLASKAYFNNELIGKYVDTIIGKVWITSISRGKMLYGRRKKEIKFKTIPHVPEILKQGHYEGKRELYKARDDGFIAFHIFTKDITIDNQIIASVQIHVGEKTNGRYEFIAYDLNATKAGGGAPRAKQEPEPTIQNQGRYIAPMRPPALDQADLVKNHSPASSSTSGEIDNKILDKVNVELETGWNIRILKVVDLATNQRIYDLEDAVDDADNIQQAVSNQAKIQAYNSAIALNQSETAALYVFDEKRTPAQRKRANNAALALLKAIDSGEKDAQNLSIVDKTILARYSGTGGALIGADGKKGSAYEYYTPAPIAAGMWDLLKDLGFSGGKVLDPCAGTGIFSALAPNNAVIDAVELNKTSAKVNQLVNNQTGRNTTIAPFEQVASATPDEIYDAVISNVPFGGVADRGGNQLLDNKYQKEPLQNYFILRSLEKLKPGGLALFIVPPRCISGKGGKEESLRVKISYLAEFLGAYRLPNKVFGSASADTMTDIIALRKYSHNVLEKIDELRQQAPEILIQANVQCPVFTQGHYFEDEGQRFVLGEFVPKDPAKFRDVDRVITDKPVAEISQMLAKFPDSRIN